jgi:hypothetical protein
MSGGGTAGNRFQRWTGSLACETAEDFIALCIPAGVAFVYAEFDVSVDLVLSSDRPSESCLSSSSLPFFDFKIFHRVLYNMIIVPSVFQLLLLYYNDAPFSFALCLFISYLSFFSLSGFQFVS